MPGELTPIAIQEFVVVFDYGDVLSLPQNPDLKQTLERRALGANEPAASFWQAYWRYRGPLDQGLTSVPEYWRLVASDLGRSYDDMAIAELWWLDFRSWLDLNFDTLAVVDALARGGTRLALLSNAGRDFVGWMRDGALSRWFERAFVSSDMRLLKPDPAIYCRVAEDLAIEPRQLAFVDNREENVGAVVELGGIGHVFTSAAELELWLRGVAAGRST